MEIRFPAEGTRLNFVPSIDTTNPLTSTLNPTALGSFAVCPHSVSLAGRASPVLMLSTGAFWALCPLQLPPPSPQPDQRSTVSHLGDFCPDLRAVQEAISRLPLSARHIATVLLHFLPGSWDPAFPFGSASPSMSCISARPFTLASGAAISARPCTLASGAACLPFPPTLWGTEALLTSRKWLPPDSAECLNIVLCHPTCPFPCPNLLLSTRI